MKQLLILGAGTAGTMAANKLRKRLDADWEVTVIEATSEHHYQPGYLFIPFGTYQPEDVVKDTRPLLADGVELVLATVDVVDTIGAGDTVTAAVVHALWELDVAGPGAGDRLLALTPEDRSSVLAFAARAAAVTVSRPGGDPPRRHELD